MPGMGGMGGGMPGGFESMGPGGFGGMPGSRKDPPIEYPLGCSLEELFKGTTKRMKISRRVVDATGQARQVQETLQVDVKPGWKNGTKITFQEKGKHLIHEPHLSESPIHAAGCPSLLPVFIGSQPLSRLDSAGIVHRLLLGVARVQMRTWNVFHR